MIDIKSTYSEYIAETYSRNDLVIMKAKGSEAFDENGKRYIDLGAGIAVNILGYCDDEFADAVAKQARTVSHTSNLYYTEPQAHLAKLICEKSGMKKVFFSNSGAEANECAIKAARKYSWDKYGEEAGRNKIICLNHSFHGRTIATISATGQSEYHKYFAPFLPGYVFVEPNDIEAMVAEAKKGDVCAIIAEIIQGEGGVNLLNTNYIKSLQTISEENDLVLIIDEVQTGNGRTGKYFAYQNFDIKPDIVTTAKGLGGGLPIGATLFNDRLANTLTPGTHGSTFGGNPIVCAGAVSIVESIDDKLLDEVKAKSEYIFTNLRQCGGVKSVTGMGLMIGIETDKNAKEIVKLLADRGVLVLTAKTKLRLVPALNIPVGLLKEAIGIMKEVLQ